jgi:adenylate kinase
MKIIFIGPQGSGKGTQAKILSKDLNILHISTGDLLRGAEGDLKQELNDYMNQGKLVPDELIVKILKKRINQPDAQNGFILDGFPRNISQNQLLEGITEIDKVLEITLSDEEAIKRISGRISCKECGEGYNTLTAPKPQQENKCDKCQGELTKRTDDTEEAVKKRLEIYHTETEPILEEYKEDAIKVNGEQTIEKIAQDIKEKLDVE